MILQARLTFDNSAASSSNDSLRRATLSFVVIFVVFRV